MNTTKTDILIKHSSFIAISNQISLLQRKLFNFLVAYAYAFLKTDEIYEIPMRLLKDQLWFNSKNSEYFKESLKKLISTVVEFNLLGKDKEEWSASALLSSVTFKDKTLYYSFSPLLRNKLYQPNVYSKLNLNLIKLFSSKYSLCMYEIIADYRKIKQTPFIELDLFRKLMGVDVWKYSEFKRLKARVITPALAELNSVAGFGTTIVYKKKWRVIVALKFLIEEIVQETPISKDDKKIQENSNLQISLIDGFGLTLRQANSVIIKYPLPYIKETLTMIKIKRKQWLIKNIPAYTITVLKNDYVQFSSTEKQSLLWSTQKSWQTRKEEMGWSENKTVSDLLYDANYNRVFKNQKKAYEYFYSLAKEEQDKLVKQFEKEKITSDIFRTIYKRDGINWVIFKTMFGEYLSWNISLVFHENL